MIAGNLVNFKLRSAWSWIVPLYKRKTIWFILDKNQNRTKKWYRQTLITPCIKLLQYLKRALVCWDRLITENKYQKALTRDSAKVILFKFRKLSRCIIWNKLLLHGWFKQGMPLTKEVVKLIKNYNWFKLCYI